MLESSEGKGTRGTVRIFSFPSIQHHGEGMMKIDVRWTVPMYCLFPEVEDVFSGGLADHTPAR